jgi:hypothetical protein
MGYSARYFSLLASESAVMKTSVYTEFFSGECGRGIVLQSGLVRG